MNVLYKFYWSKEKGNSLSFPREVEEMEKFFIKNKMNSEFVKKFLHDVKVVREVLP